jgi:hypothetical protein
MRYADLGTASDVARDHRVTRGAVAQWKRNHADFPEPAMYLRGNEAVYDLAEVRAFCKTHKLGKR